MFNSEILISNIEKIIKEKSIPAKTLALELSKLGAKVDQSKLSKIRNGGKPDLDFMLALSQYSGLSIDELLGNKTEKEKTISVRDLCKIVVQLAEQSDLQFKEYTIIEKGVDLDDNANMTNVEFERKGYYLFFKHFDDGMWNKEYDLNCNYPAYRFNEFLSAFVSIWENNALDKETYKTIRNALISSVPDDRPMEAPFSCKKF